MNTFSLIVAILSVSCARKVWNNQNGDPLDTIQQFTKAVALSYFSDTQCIAVIATQLSVQLYFSELPMIYISYNGNETEFDTRIFKAIDTGCLAFVFQTDDIRWMVEKISELYSSPRSIHRSNRQYLFFPKDITNTESSWEAAIDEAFASRSMDWMPDLLAVHLVIGKDAKNKLNSLKQMYYGTNTGLRKKLDIQEAVSIEDLQKNNFLEIYTHLFVGENPSERILLDIWFPNYGFMIGQNLFPDKLSQLMGKELTITSISYPPFSLIQLDTEPPVFEGIDFQIWYEFTKKHNCTWNLVLDLENWWGVIWENGSGNGMAGAIAEDRADISFGAIYMFHREFFYTDFSICYYRTGVTTVTPKPKHLPGWMIPMRPFSSFMWYAVLASIVVISTTLYTISKASQALTEGNISSRYSTMVECAFRTAGLLVLQIPDDERDYATPRYAPMRHLVTWLILFFLVVSSAYGGSLSSILTLPQFEPPIETAKDLADSGFQWAAVVQAFVSYLESSSNPVMQTLTRNFIALPEEELVKRAFDDHLALAVERLEDHYAEVKYIFEEMMQGRRLMKEDLMFGHCVFAIRKGSPYRNPLNDVLYRLREAGILLYWEGMTVRTFLSERRQLSVMQSRTPPEVEHTKLAFSHVQGAFYLLIMGFSVALVTFSLEVLQFRYLKKKKN